MNVLQAVLTTAWVYAPAMVANMAPVFIAKTSIFSSLNRPLDLGYAVGGTRLFGSHKTMRGFIIACIAGAITGGIQAQILHQNVLHGLFVGMVVGFGAITGDVIKSFFKRRLRIPSGTSWIPFDQIDFVIGATVAGMFVEKISLVTIVIAIIGIGFASYVVSVVGVALHFKKSL